MAKETTTKDNPEESEVTIVPTKENASVEIVPFGTTDRIRLSAAIVRQMIATPTKSGKQPDDNQCIKFIMLCKARHLNPFEGDAFMLGYDTQSGPQFSLITAHQVFLKRAEASKGFNGMESGVIIRRPDHDGKIGGGPIEEREGDLVYDDERLIGGWAKVFRKDREKPFYRRLKLATFNTGRSRWEKDPAGMIVKCAEADALRTAFPTHLGGLYVEEELPPITVTDQLPIKQAQIARVRGGKKALKDSEPEHNGEDGGSGGAAPEPTEPPAPAATKPEPKKKLNGIPSREAVEGPPPNETELLKRLESLGVSKEKFVAVAKGFDVIDQDQGWDDIGEARFETMLRESNWPLVEAELKL